MLYNLNYIVSFIHSRLKPLLDFPLNEPWRKECRTGGERHKPELYVRIASKRDRNFKTFDFLGNNSVLYKMKIDPLNNIHPSS